jgi:hypothetical protein
MTMAAIYARVSSVKQKEEATIASQTALRTFAERQGLEVCNEWIFEDEGVSGATLVRPPWTACATSSLRSRSRSCSSTPRTAWRAAMPTRRC